MLNFLIFKATSGFNCILDAIDKIGAPLPEMTVDEQLTRTTATCDWIKSDQPCNGDTSDGVLKNRGWPTRTIPYVLLGKLPVKGQDKERTEFFNKCFVRRVLDESKGALVRKSYVPFLKLIENDMNQIHVDTKGTDYEIQFKPVPLSEAVNLLFSQKPVLFIHALRGDRKSSATIGPTVFESRKYGKLNVALWGIDVPFMRSIYDPTLVFRYLMHVLGWPGDDSKLQKKNHQKKCKPKTRAAHGFYSVTQKAILNVKSLVPSKVPRACPKGNQGSAGDILELRKQDLEVLNQLFKGLPAE